MDGSNETIIVWLIMGPSNRRPAVKSKTGRIFSDNLQA